MSCRYDADYRGDAMLRGRGVAGTEPCLDYTLDILIGTYQFPIVYPRLTPKDGFKALACGQTITGLSLSESSPHAFYRTNNLVANQGFRARFFTIQIDNTGRHCIRIGDVSGFSPYVTVSRSSSIKWSGAVTPPGCLYFDVSVGQTGPMIVEVSSVLPHQSGSFFIQLECPVEDDFSIIHLLCGTPVTGRIINPTHFYRGFDYFSPFWPVTYEIRLTNVVGFSPYIYIDTVLNNLPSGGNSLMVPNRAGALGFVGQLNDPFVSGSFDIELICPFPGSVRVDPDSLDVINTDTGAGFTGVMDYIDGSNYYEEVSGFQNMRLTWESTPFGGFWYFNVNSGYASLGPEGTPPTDPYGVYNIVAGEGAYYVEIVPV